MSDQKVSRPAASSPCSARARAARWALLISMRKGVCESCVWTIETLAQDPGGGEEAGWHGGGGSAVWAVRKAGGEADCNGKELCLGVQQLLPGGGVPSRSPPLFSEGTLLRAATCVCVEFPRCLAQCMHATACNAIQTLSPLRVPANGVVVGTRCWFLWVCLLFPWASERCGVARRERGGP